MIVTDEQALRIKCEDVLPEEYSQLKEKLDSELKRSALYGMPGIGLAAPQIGIAKKMAIVRVNDYKIDLVNPVLVMGYDMMVFDGEGCLSFPGKYEKTNRYNIVHIENSMGTPQRFIADGILAVCCQHEMDHLIGKLLPDVAIKSNNPNEPCPCGSGKKFKKCCKRKQ